MSQFFPIQTLPNEIILYFVESLVSPSPALGPEGSSHDEPLQEDSLEVIAGRYGYESWPPRASEEYSRSRAEILARLCLTSRVMNDIARKVLYRHVRIHNGKAMALLLRTLATTPDLRALVRELSFTACTNRDPYARDALVVWEEFMSTVRLTSLSRSTQDTLAQAWIGYSGSGKKKWPRKFAVNDVKYMGGALLALCTSMETLLVRAPTCRGDESSDFWSPTDLLCIPTMDGWQSHNFKHCSVTTIRLRTDHWPRLATGWRVDCNHEFPELKRLELFTTHHVIDLHFGGSHGPPYVVEELYIYHAGASLGPVPGIIGSTEFQDLRSVHIEVPAGLRTLLRRSYTTEQREVLREGLARLTSLRKLIIPEFWEDSVPKELDGLHVELV